MVQLLQSNCLDTNLKIKKNKKRTVKFHGHKIAYIIFADLINLIWSLNYLGHTKNVICRLALLLC